jgi:hypothetical protein
VHCRTRLEINGGFGDIFKVPSEDSISNFKMAEKLHSRGI